MSKVLNLYKGIITGLGLVIRDDDVICVNSKDETPVKTSLGIEWIIPTKEAENRLLKKNEKTKKLELAYVPFNPLREDSLKVNTSIKELKRIIQLRLSTSLQFTGLVLLETMLDPNKQNNIGSDISKFITNTRRLMKGNVKNLVDDTTMKVFSDICNKSLTTNNTLVKISLKRGKKDKFNRECVITSGVVDLLANMDKPGEVLGIQIKRNKDLIVIKEILKFITGLENSDDSIVLGSNDKLAPVFASLMHGYNYVKSNVDLVLKHCKHASLDYVDNARLEDICSEDTLEDLDAYKVEVKNLPDETDLTKNINMSKNESSVTNNIQNITPEPYQPFVKDTPNENNNPQANKVSAAEKALYGGKRPEFSSPTHMLNQGMYGNDLNQYNPMQQNMMYQQPQPMQPPMQQNMMHQPPQPMYNPMAQQPMGQPQMNSYNMQQPQPMYNPMGQQPHMNQYNMQQPTQQNMMTNPVSNPTLGSDINPHRGRVINNGINDDQTQFGKKQLPKVNI